MILIHKIQQATSSAEGGRAEQAEPTHRTGQNTAERHGAEQNRQRRAEGSTAEQETEADQAGRPDRASTREPAKRAKKTRHRAATGQDRTKRAGKEQYPNAGGH